ncbi:hypothetical protein ACE6H2_018988 [Prunus campanulata]
MIARADMVSLLGLTGSLLTMEAIVLHNISDNVVAVYTKNRTHCLDLLRGNSSDPEWLVNQRKIEVRIIKGRIDKYSVDLQALKHEKPLQN